jgi:uncharacterized phage protein gp47/JayE
MALTTPTTKDISDAIIAQWQATFNQTIPLLPKSFLRVAAKVLAAVFILLYKYTGFMFLQMFVQTASDVSTTVNGIEINPLTFWGRLIGIGDPIAAVQAELLIDITVTNQVGSLPAGTQLIGQTNGVTYITLAVVPLDAALKQTTVRAVSDPQGGGGAGTIGNLDAGQIVSFANPLANVSRDAVVDSQTTTGAEREATEAYRQRILDKFQARPQGGALADYRLWGSEVAGVANIYPYTSDCPGQVDVYVEATTAIDPDGIPTPAILQDVLDAINLDSAGLATRRPANALANTFSITRTDFDVEVSNLTVDDTATVEAEIESALTEYFLNAEPYIEGLTVPPRADTITQAAVSGIVQDVVSAAGGLFSGAVLKEGAATITTRTLATGEKAKLDTVTFL